MTLLIEDRSDAQLPPDMESRWTETLNVGLAYADAPSEVEISLSLVTTEEIRQLNNTYRRQDRTTDVLSFPFFEPGEAKQWVALPGMGEAALGDIVICPEVAKTQAADYGHSYTRELAFLAVHGLLHLLGYDHENADDEQAMIDAQEAILKKTGINRINAGDEAATAQSETAQPETMHSETMHPETITLSRIKNL